MELIIDYNLLAKLVSDDLKNKPIVPLWLSTPQLSVYCGLSIGTLEDYRRRKIGPTYSKVGRHVRYSRENVDKWLKEKQVNVQ